MTENKEVMARNIRYYMDKNGVNATELCNTLGIKHNTFSDWVNAKSYPRIDKIERMAQYFNISKAFLVEDIEEVDIITNDEKKMILEFRQADKITQDAIRRLLAYRNMKYDN